MRADCKPVAAVQSLCLRVSGRVVGRGHAPAAGIRFHTCCACCACCCCCAGRVHMVTRQARIKLVNKLLSAPFVRLLDCVFLK